MDGQKQGQWGREWRKYALVWGGRAGGVGGRVEHRLYWGLGKVVKGKANGGVNTEDSSKIEGRKGEWGGSKMKERGAGRGRRGMGALKKGSGVGMGVEYNGVGWGRAVGVKSVGGGRGGGVGVGAG